MHHLRKATLALIAAALMVALVAAAGAAAADPAVSTAVAEPAPSPTAAPALTLTAAPEEVTAGRPATLAIHLGVSGAQVRLSRMRAGETVWSLVAALAADAAGDLTYGVSPQVTTAYRVDYAGDSLSWLPAFAETTVSVRPHVSFSVAPRAYRDGRARLRVAVQPAHPGVSVALQVLKDGAWTDVRAVRLGHGSTARAAWRPDAAGKWQLRVRMAADADHAEGTSAVRKVAVIRSNPYHVPIDARHMIVVDISQYRLHYFSRGVELRSFPVVTGRPSLPTPLGHFKVYAKGMWPGGPYGARIMSYHPPCAIHGTNEPSLLRRFPRNFSHGCTRLYNHDVIWLYDHTPIGTPVWNVR